MVRTQSAFSLWRNRNGGSRDFQGKMKGPKDQTVVSRYLKEYTQHISFQEKNTIQDVETIEKYI